MARLNFSRRENDPKGRDGVQEWNGTGWDHIKSVASHGPNLDIAKTLDLTGNGHESPQLSLLL
jgi:hypothetical protein